MKPPKVFIYNKVSNLLILAVILKSFSIRDIPIFKS
jgi:hypothetical protein